MVRILLFALIVSLFSACSGSGFLGKQKQNETITLNNNHDTLSYALGVAMAQSLKDMGYDSINFEAMTHAIENAFNGDSLLIPEEEALNVFQESQSLMEQRRIDKQKAAGKSFLAENAKRADVKTTASGLQYEVLTMGDGPKPQLQDQVKTHYEGRLMDGQIFDSSYQRGQPATFPLRGVIKGWTEALQLMPVGSKFRLYIPEDLGYGARGAGQSIPPYATLIFDVELLEIIK